MLKRIVLIFMSLLFCSTAYALRCGTQLIEVGDSKAKVIELCGPPTSKNKMHKHVEQLPFELTTKKHSLSYQESWTYNFGARDFLYVLVFNKGSLTEIQTNGYGY